MSKRAGVLKSFESEVAQHFGPLAAEFGWARSIEPNRVAGVRCVAYGSAPLIYRVCYVQDDHGVFTAVHMVAGHHTLVAYLEELVPAAGLGSRQDVPTSVNTLYTLRRALSGQVGWVRRLHPTLAGSEGVDLMRRAGARKW
ncbi:MAG TPA: hypothetical protein VFX70_15805 [Mycobacteriales bacterium]|nr:hypothetical protein [Mycobacteriales bacterium]